LLIASPSISLVYVLDPIKIKSIVLTETPLVRRESGGGQPLGNDSTRHPTGIRQQSVSISVSDGAKKVREA
jgi:hypothetical protein